MGQDTPLKFSVWVGAVCGSQFRPSVVSTIPRPPTAVHSSIVKHEAEFSVLVPAGGFWAVHDNPPVTVPMIVDPAPLLPLLPTAMQSSGPEHEMLVRSTALDGTD